MPKAFNELLQGNANWVASMRETQPDLFKEMATGQQPETLWIGCADSRVPAEVVTNSLPGSIFVQRNVANLVVHTDYSLLSVVNYAVKALRVKHLVVCGHYGCGGIKAALSNDSFGLLDNWLANIKEVYRIHARELDQIEDPVEKERTFIELNVKEQVNNLAKLSFIQEEWKNEPYPHIHGWVFDISSGKIKDLNISINSAAHLNPVYQYS